MGITYHTWVRERRPEREIIIPANGLSDADISRLGRLFGFLCFSIICHINNHAQLIYIDVPDYTASYVKKSLAHYIVDGSFHDRFRYI